MRLVTWTAVLVAVAASCGPGSEHTVELLLRNHGMDAVRDRARHASDPSSALFGRFLSFDQLKQLVHRTESLTAAREFLSIQPVSAVRVSQDGQWLRFRTNSTCVAAAASTALRGHLAMTVEHVPGYASPENRLYQEAMQSVPSAWPPGPYLKMSDIRQYYNVTQESRRAEQLASAAVFEVNALLYDGRVIEQYNPLDLQSFQKLSNLTLDPVRQFAGDNVTLGCSGYSCAEPVLDVSLLRGMAPQANFTYWSTDIPNTRDSNAVLQWLLRLSGTQSPSWVHSISWGPPESSVSQPVAQRMDEEFAKLSARGLTFVSSSGDDGVNQRTARGFPAHCGLAPQYPASSPWVVAVGGTMGPEQAQHERTCQADAGASITSGGGFSGLWAQPSYQHSAVAQYLQRAAATLPPASMFNQSMRAYPDVALVAQNIDTVVNQSFFAGAGTSASAPLFAGMLATILQARFNRGLPPFGLLNTHLYQLAGGAAFNDVIEGANHCTGIYGADRNYTCCPSGFNATAGWDPVTGLGSVNYRELKKQLLLVPALS